MKASVAGAVAGFLATVPMTVVMLVGQQLLPRREQYALPPERITAEVMERVDSGASHDQSRRWSLSLLTHFGFGSVAGAGLGAISSQTGTSPSVIGIPYALGVWVVSYLGWLPAAKILPPATEHPARRNILMLLAHVIWGATAGMIIERRSP